MRRFFLYTNVFLMCLFSPFFLEAQQAVPGNQGGGGGGNTNFAATGTLVASAMETVGYHAQGQILSDLSEDLAELGALIYLGVLFSMILTAALMGQYRAALWAIVGPPLFVYASGIELSGQSNRIDSRGPEWKLGAFEDPGGYREELIKGRQPVAQVSFLFHKYNELISELFQEIIDKLTSSDVNKQLIFMSRQRVIEELFGTALTEPNLKSLMQHYLSVCNSELTYARQVGQGMRDPHFRATNDYDHAKDKYCELYPIKNKNIESSAIREYVKSLQLDDSETANFDQNTPVSCLDMWKWVREGGKRAVESQLEEIISSNVPPEAFDVAGNEIVDKIKNDIRKKISIGDASNSGEDPCPQTLGSGGGGAAFISSSDWLSNLFSGLLIRKDLLAGPGASGFRRILGGDHGVPLPYEEEFNMRKVSPVANLDSIRKQKAHQFAEGRRYEAFTLIMLFPYLQGILLFVLSVLYPFFAMLILIPGQANNFLSWLALWAWVKSWDIGWAAIMVVDELLWDIMPKNTFHNLSDSSQETPASLMETHFSGDYAYSTTMYWLLLSGMVSLVPIITAEAILGAKKSIANTLTGGVTDLASRLSTGAESYSAVKNISGELQRSEAEQMLPRAEGLLQMNSGIKNMLGSMDRGVGISGGQRSLEAVANNARNTGIMSTPGGGGGAALDETQQNADKQRGEQDQRTAAGKAMENIRNGSNPNARIGDDPGMQGFIQNYLASVGLDEAGLKARGIEDPEQQANLINNFANNVIAHNMFASHVKESGDVKLAWNTVIGALGAMKDGPLNVPNIIRRGVDAGMDTNKAAVAMRRESNNAIKWHLQNAASQMAWERANTPEFYQREAFRAYFSDNRREWMGYAPPLIGIEASLQQENFEKEYMRTGESSDLWHKSAASYWDQISRHFAPVNKGK